MPGQKISLVVCQAKKYLWFLARPKNIFGFLPGKKISLFFCQAEKYLWFFARPKNIFGCLPGQKISFVVCQANHVRLSMKDENAPNKGGIEPTFFRLGLIIFCFCFIIVSLKLTCFQSRKPSSRQEGKRLHLEAEIEALPRWANFFQSEQTFSKGEPTFLRWIWNRPEISWYLGSQLLAESEKYSFYRAIMVSFESFSWIFWKQKKFLNLDYFQPSNPNIHFVRLTINEPSPTDGGNYIVRAVNAVGEDLNPHFPSLNLCLIFLKIIFIPHFPSSHLFFNFF